MTILDNLKTFHSPELLQNHYLELKILFLEFCLLAVIRLFQPRRTLSMWGNTHCETRQRQKTIMNPKESLCTAGMVIHKGRWESVTTVLSIVHFAACLFKGSLAGILQTYTNYLWSKRIFPHSKPHVKQKGNMNKISSKIPEVGFCLSTQKCTETRLYIPLY